MGNAQSDIASHDGDGGQKISPATNDYDPKGEVIPDVNPYELLRSILKLEKFERCLSCVPLTIDPRSPTAQQRDSSIAEMAAAATATMNNKVSDDENDVDVMSTIEEGEDGDEDTTFSTKQQQDHNTNGEWGSPTVNENDPSAILWDTDASNQAEEYKSTSEDFPEFNPDKLAEGGEYGSNECTEFDPDAMFDPDTMFVSETHQQQQQQPVLSDELDDVLMMRSDENSTDELYPDGTSASQSTGNKSTTCEEPSQKFIGLKDPMDEAQRACNAMSPTNKKYQIMTEVDDVEEIENDVQQQHAAGDAAASGGDDYYYQKEEENNCSHSFSHEVDEEKEQDRGSNQFGWTVQTEYDMNQLNWNDNHQPVVKAEEGNANDIANKHFDDIISDFELSPGPEPREKAYSNVRSFKSQRAQKQKRNKRKNNAPADEKISKAIQSPETSTAFFVEETTVGRKLNGILAKAKVYKQKELDTTPIYDEGKTIPDPVIESADVYPMNQNQGVNYSSFSDNGSDHDEVQSMDGNVGDSYSSSGAADFDDADREKDVESYSSYNGDETGPTENPIESSGIASYSADEMITESVGSTESEKKIVSDSSGESTTASSAFEETHAKLKDLMKEASYESDSPNDSVDWDNLAYSMSDGSSSNIKKDSYSYDEVMITRQSSEEETCRQHSPLGECASKPVDASHSNEENVTPTLTVQEMEDKIQQMKKQHEEELKSYLKEPHNSPRHKRYIEVKQRIDAMRDQHKSNIDNMRAVMNETDDHRNPLDSGRSKGVLSPNTSSRFNFDDNASGKMDNREKSIRELMKQNAKLEEEMQLLRLMSPKSPNTPKFSFSPKPASGRKSHSLNSIHAYSPRILYKPSPASARNESETYESREKLTMIVDANADEEHMNTRVDGMIADIKSFLQENDKVQERLSKDIMSYGVMYEA